MSLHRGLFSFLLLLVLLPLALHGASILPSTSAPTALSSEGKCFVVLICGLEVIRELLFIYHYIPSCWGQHHVDLFRGFAQRCLIISSSLTCASISPLTSAMHLTTSNCSLCRCACLFYYSVKENRFSGRVLRVFPGRWHVKHTPWTQFALAVHSACCDTSGGTERFEVTDHNSLLGRIATLQSFNCYMYKMYLLYAGHFGCQNSKEDCFRYGPRPVYVLNRP